jgi:hypothetical protein
MKWAILFLGAVGGSASTGCCWRQPPAYGAYPAPAASYAPAYAAPAYGAPAYGAPPCQPVQQPACMPVQAAPACTCY